MATDGDLYLRDGETYTNGVYYPGRPVEQVEEEAQEQGIIASSYPVMDDVAEWFKDAIATCDSIDNITVQEVKIGNVTYSRTVHIEAQVLAYQLLKQLLEEKANEFAEFGKERS